MSYKINVDMPCPECITISQTELWFSINVQLNPEAKTKLLDGMINVFQCGNCDYKAIMPNPLLYHDMENELCVQLYRFENVNDRDFLERFTVDGQFKSSIDLPKEHLRAYLKNIHIVFSMEEMIRYIVFRDNLISRANARSSGIVCYHCGSTMMNNEPYFCIERLRLLKTPGTENPDEITYAASSIQMCSECALKAGSGGIEWKYRPPLLMQLEKDGIIQFARSSNSLNLKPNSINRDTCQMCKTDINVGDTYTRIDARKEIKKSGETSTIRVQPLAIICTDCSQKYMQWP